MKQKPSLIRVVFELEGSNANVINNMIGSTFSFHKHKCGDSDSDADGVMNLFVAGTELVYGRSDLVAKIGELGSKNLDKFVKYAGVGNSAFAILSIGAKFAVDNNKQWYEKLSFTDYLSISSAAFGMAAALGAAPITGIAAAGLSLFCIGKTVYDLYNDGYENCSPESDSKYKNLARKNQAHAYDPLILDLNGDGIKTIAMDGFSGSLFDHDNDGIRTATGWVQSDDGILVWDRNGDGIINNGSELFGDNTLLANGQNAAHGYEALAELDSNADGVINALDHDFGSLKVWQDFSQDGITQDDELFTLQTLGIESLNLAHQETNQNLGHGNRLTHLGSYTKTDGTMGKMGDAAFTNDPFYSKFADYIELIPEQMQAANLKGIGRLRDLRQAAALSPELAEVLQSYSEAETKEAQLAWLSDLIGQWSATDTQKSDIASFKLSSDLEISNQNGGLALTLSQVAALCNGLVLDDKTQTEFNEIRSKIAVLDAFTGQKSETLYFGTQAQARQIIHTVN